MIWLNYINGATPPGVSMRFDPISVRERASVTRRGGETLRGTTYDHRLGARRTWEIVISADELIDADRREFVLEFFLGGRRFISFEDVDTAPTTTWVGVAIEGGDAPIEAIEGNERLVEWTFRLIEKEAM